MSLCLQLCRTLLCISTRAVGRSSSCFAVSCIDQCLGSITHLRTATDTQRVCVFLLYLSSMKELVHHVQPFKALGAHLRVLKGSIQTCWVQSQVFSLCFCCCLPPSLCGGQLRCHKSFRPHVGLGGGSGARQNALDVLLFVPLHRC